MKIAIIGCGYVGTALAVKFKRDGHYVTTTTRTLSKVPTLELISDRVLVLHAYDIKLIQELLEDQDAVVLCIAADSQSSYELTYLDTAKALEEALKHSPNVRNVIYTGSTSVYGDHQGGVVDENTPSSAVSVNSRILIETENILLGLSRDDRRICVFRLGEIYGPGRFISDRLRRLQTQGVKLPGDGSSITNLIHLEDIVSGISFALDRSLNGIYNLCNDMHMTRRDFYAQICVDEGLPPVEWDPLKVSVHGGNKLVSNAKIKSVGFKFSK